jgi:hypothetical protein
MVSRSEAHTSMQKLTAVTDTRHWATTYDTGQLRVYNLGFRV